MAVSSIELRLLVGGERRRLRLQRVQVGELGGREQVLRLRQLRIAHAIDRGQELEEIGAHVITPRLTLAGLGSRTRISAGNGSDVPVVALGM